jgi:cystathionine beta-synthase
VEPSPEARTGTQDQFDGATVKTLRLKPVTTVLSNSTCEAAIEVMREKGFDQLPVLAPTGKRLVGLVTLGNILSRITHGRASGKSPVSDVMFNFSKLSEVVTDPRDVTGLTPLLTPSAHKEDQGDDGSITMDTPLSALNRFFEWNSAAVVTEKGEQGVMKPVAIATKVDLLTWLLQRSKVQG